MEKKNRFLYFVPSQICIIVQNGLRMEIMKKYPTVSNDVPCCPTVSHVVQRCPTVSNGDQRWTPMDCNVLQSSLDHPKFFSRFLVIYTGPTVFYGFQRRPTVSSGVPRCPTASNVVPRCPMSSHVAVQFRLSKILFVAFRNPKWTVLAWFWAWYRIIVQCLYLSM